MNQKYPETTEGLIDFINDFRGVTFVEIGESFPSFFGGNEIVGITEKNIVFWIGLSKTGSKIITELINSKSIHMQMTDPMVYAFDGGLLQLPLAKNNSKRYEELHWLPVTLSPRKKVHE